MAELFSSFEGVRTEGLSSWLLAHLLLLVVGLVVVHLARRHTRPAKAAMTGVVVAVAALTIVSVGDGGCGVLQSYTGIGTCSDMLGAFRWWGSIPNAEGPLHMADLTRWGGRVLKMLQLLTPLAFGLAALGPRPPRRAASSTATAEPHAV